MASMPQCHNDLMNPYDILEYMFQMSQIQNIQNWPAVASGPLSVAAHWKAFPRHSYGAHD